jgi:anti-anti-sigma factor
LYYVAVIVSFDEEQAILRIAGDEDRTTSGRRRRPLSVAFKATRDVIVDLTDLRFADPSLMIDLACLAQRLRAQERVLWLSGAQPGVRRLIETVGLDRLPAVRLMGSRPPARSAVAL